MKPWTFAAAAAAGIVLAVVVSLWVTPDTGDVPTVQVAAPLPPAPTPADHGTNVASRAPAPVVPLVPPATPTRAPPTPSRSNTTLDDLQGVRDVPADRGPVPLTQEGLRTLQDRFAEPLAMCHRWFPDGGRDAEIALTIGGAEGGPAYVRAAEAIEAPDDPIGPCVQAALRDATFRALPPGTDEARIEWSLPAPN